MADPNLRDFYGRINRIEQARALGYGFEAQGTLGLSHYRKAERRRIPIFGPLFVVVLMALAMKGAIHYKVGAATYDQRVERLQAGEGFDRLGAWLMQADPATVMVSEFIREMVR